MKTQNPSSLDGLQLNQICKQCAQNSAKEQIVSIYYAKEESRSSLGGPYSETVTINYKDISVKEYFICQVCINNGTKLFLWIAFACLIITIPSCILGLMTDIPIFFFIAMGGALGIGLPLGLALRELRSTEAKNQGAYNKASTRALALTKKELLNFGYDKFWTKEEFDSLNLIFKPNL